ncbi:MAG: DNA-binding protein, partial [Pseudomonadota bacterium]
GSKRYTRAIMYIETSELFTQPEFLYLLTCCGVYSHRNCEACTERPGCIC